VDEEQMHNGVQTNPKRQEIPFVLTAHAIGFLVLHIQLNPDGSITTTSVSGPAEY
jgi:hypothetical protein